MHLLQYQIFMDSFSLSKYTIVNSDSPSLSSGCFFWPSLHKLGIFNKMYWKQIMFDIFCSFYSLAANTWSWLTHFVNMSPLQTKPNSTIKNFLEGWKKLSKRRGSHWDEFCQFIGTRHRHLKMSIISKMTPSWIVHFWIYCGILQFYVSQLKLPIKEWGDNCLLIVAFCGVESRVTRVSVACFLASARSIPILMKISSRLVISCFFLLTPFSLSFLPKQGKLFFQKSSTFLNFNFDFSVKIIQFVDLKPVLENDYAGHSHKSEKMILQV